MMNSSSNSTGKRMLRVFIADESKAVREQLAAMINELDGVELVGQAGNALAAIEGILQQKPEVAILDIRLPAGNNIQAIRAVKAVIPSIQIIILTEFPYPQYEQKCLEAGAEYFFDKSCETEAVIELLRNFSQSDAVNPPTHILMIEGNASDSMKFRNYMRDASRPRIMTTSVENLASGLELLDVQSFDIILLDLQLPDSNGLKTLQAVLPKAADNPVLVMLDFEDKELFLEVAQLGARDCLVKSQLNSFSLRRVICYAIEHKHTSKRLREEHDQSEQYLSMAEVILLTLDTRGVITYINRKGSLMLGYEEQELIGRNWFDTCLPAAVSGSVKSAFHEIMSGKISSFEFVQNPILTKSGQERFVSWHNAILKDGQGNIAGSLSSGGISPSINVAKTTSST